MSGRVPVVQIAVLLALGPGWARADLTGAYDGQLQTGRSGSVTVVGALTQSSGALSATIDIALSDARGGVYELNGRQHRGHALLRGTNGDGTRLTWHADVRAGNTLRGPVQIHWRHQGMRAVLLLRLRPITPPLHTGTCDS